MVRRAAARAGTDSPDPGCLRAPMPWRRVTQAVDRKGFARKFGFETKIARFARSRRWGSRTYGDKRGP